MRARRNSKTGSGERQPRGELIAYDELPKGMRRRVANRVWSRVTGEILWQDAGLDLDTVIDQELRKKTMKEWREYAEGRW